MSNPYEQKLKNQQLGNFLLAFSDTLRGANPAQGVLQRQQLLKQQEDEIKAKENFNRMYATLNEDQKRIVDLQRAGIDLRTPTDRKIIKGADGFNYFVDTGERVLPEVATNSETSKRATIKGADGFNYFVDTGERVLPGVVTSPNIEGQKLSFANEDKLRDEHQKLSGTFISVRDAYGRILSNAEEQTAASDLSLIFNYMKMLDPGSVVREGEFANAQNSAGVPDQIKAKYNSILRGERLAKDTRKDFIQTAQDLYKTQSASQRYLDNNYRNLANAYDLDPNKVVLDFGSPIAKKEFKYNLSIMSNDELANLDENEFTKEQIKEINKEIDKRLN